MYRGAGRGRWKLDVRAKDVQAEAVGFEGWCGVRDRGRGVKASSWEWGLGPALGGEVKSAVRTPL